MLFPAWTRWIAKHSSGNCGVGTTLVKWNYQTDAIFSRCNMADETPEHIFTCDHISVKEKKDQVILQIENFLK